MSRLIILGGGGHARVVAEAAAEGGTWIDIGYLDDNPRLAEMGHVLGAFEDVFELGQDADVVVALGDGEIRLGWVRRLLERGMSVVSVIHPSAIISKSSRIGPGSVVLANAVISSQAEIGRAAIINTAATVDHDCMLADGVHVCPGAHLAGSVTIGECSWIGIGCVVKQGITIGREAIIGAGAAVISNIPDGVTAVGVPAKIRG